MIIPNSWKQLPVKNKTKKKKKNKQIEPFLVNGEWLYPIGWTGKRQ